MRELEQYHSLLHDQDNKYHTDPNCPVANNIIKRCQCTERQPLCACSLCRVRP